MKQFSVYSLAFADLEFCCLAQAGLRVSVFLPQPLVCWDHSCVSLCSALDNLFRFVFLDKVSCIPGWPRTCYVANDDLELPVPPLPEGGDCRHVATIPSFCSAENQTQGLLHVRPSLPAEIHYQPLAGGFCCLLGFEIGCLLCNSGWPATH